MYEDVKFYGRGTYPQEDGRIPLFWTGSGFEFDTDASEAYMTVSSDFSSNEQWFAIWLDGVMISRRMANRGTEKVCLFRGKTESENTRVRVTKETQPMGDDPSSFLIIDSIECGGAMKRPPRRKYSIEAIGDSITSGEGTYGRKKAMEWISAYFSYERTWECRLGELLDADVSVVSMSGWGVTSAWDNNQDNRIPAIYDQVCEPARGSVNRSFGSGEHYDFRQHMDAVVINLGTNDMGSFDNPEWVSADGSRSFQNCRNADGEPSEDDEMRFSFGVSDFLMKIHKNNPDAYIIWVYGQFGYMLSMYISLGIADFIRKSGYRRVTLLTLPCITEATEGSREHPGCLSHRECAEMIADAIAKENYLK